MTVNLLVASVVTLSMAKVRYVPRGTKFASSAVRRVILSRFAIHGTPKERIPCLVHCSAVNASSLPQLPVVIGEGFLVKTIRSNVVADTGAQGTVAGTGFDCRNMVHFNNLGLCRCVYPTMRL